MFFKCFYIFVYFLLLVSVCKNERICLNDGTNIDERCYCRSGFYGQQCQFQTESCEYKSMSPLKFDSSFELEDFSIDQKTISIELSFPLYENRKYTKIAFEGLENHLNCSFPNYDDQYNKWTKNISNDCREVFKADLSWEKIKRDCGWRRNETETQIIYSNKIDIKHVDEFNISSVVFNRLTERSFDVQLIFSKIVQVNQQISLLNDFVNSAAIVQFSFENEQKKGSFKVQMVSDYPYTTQHRQTFFENEKLILNLISDEFVSCQNQKCTQILTYDLALKPEFKECQFSEAISIPFNIKCVDDFLQDNECVINPLKLNDTMQYNIEMSDLCLESSINIGLTSTMKTYNDEFENESSLFALNQNVFTKINLEATSNVNINEIEIIDLMFAKDRNGVLDGIHLIKDLNKTIEGELHNFELIDSPDSSEYRFKFSLNSPSLIDYNTIYCKLKVTFEDEQTKRSIEYQYTSSNDQQKTINTRSSIYGIQIKNQSSDASTLIINFFRNSFWLFLLYISLVILI